jgi:cytochrome c peroxidase
LGQIQKSLASFERTLLSANSPFDQYQYGGNKQALSPAAIHGLEIFTDPQRGNCAVCHTIDAHYALFTDGKFHNTGAGINGEGDFTDLGRFGQTKLEADRGEFKTPTLRNVALTAPYMHDGSLKTLKDVVDFYVGGGNSNPDLDKQMKPLKLSAQDRADLVTFLESLNGDMPKNAGPPGKE